MMNKTKTIAAVSIITLGIFAIVYYRKKIVNMARGIQKYGLSIVQEYYIQDLHPAFQNKIRNFVKTVQDETGYTVVFTSGTRSPQKQASLNEPEAVEPFLSYHNYGMAVDFNLKRGNTIIKKSDSKNTWEATGMPAIAKRLGLRWGGNFSTYDPVHVDNGNSYSINFLLSQAKKQFGQNLSGFKGNEVKLA